MDLIVECLEDEKKRKQYNALLAKADISLCSKELTEDVGIPDFDEEKIRNSIKKEKDVDDEDIDILMKMFREKSVYQQKEKDVKVPSSIFDSVGTNKFSNLLLLILNFIENGNILLVDEIDNRLHYRIARELIQLMNSENNHKSQFIMTAHDIKLLSPLVFRKEQINFIERSKDDVVMYSLGDFDEIRNDSSFKNLYIKDKVGALPRPDLGDVFKQWAN